MRTVAAPAALRAARALGTRLAAEIYGGTVIREGVEDRDDNETRFVWLARGGGTARAAAAAPREPGGVEDLARLLGLGAERPGWLVRCLDEFARREINLTKIESRPRRERLGSYMFFADLERRRQRCAPSPTAIAGVRALCEEVRVLGSYPAAGRARRRRQAEPRVTARTRGRIARYTRR